MRNSYLKKEKNNHLLSFGYFCLPALVFHSNGFTITMKPRQERDITSGPKGVHVVRPRDFDDGGRLPRGIGILGNCLQNYVNFFVANRGCHFNDSFHQYKVNIHARSLYTHAFHYYSILSKKTLLQGRLYSLPLSFL